MNTLEADPPRATWMNVQFERVQHNMIFSRKCLLQSDLNRKASTSEHSQKVDYLIFEMVQLDKTRVSSREFPVESFQIKNAWVNNSRVNASGRKNLQKDWTNYKNGPITRMDQLQEWTNYKNGPITRMDQLQEWTNSDENTTGGSYLSGPTPLLDPNLSPNANTRTPKPFGSPANGKCDNHNWARQQTWLINTFFIKKS